jgi:hypothetical protein
MAATIARLQKQTKDSIRPQSFRPAKYAVGPKISRPADPSLTVRILTATEEMSPFNLIDKKQLCRKEHEDEKACGQEHCQYV